MLNPSGTAVPEENNARYALCGALAHMATVKNFGDIMKYIKRMPPEFQVLFVRDSLRKVADLKDSKAYTQWAANEGSSILS
jgi:hypothetical protein